MFVLKYALISVLGALAIIVMSKVVVNFLLRRDADYYEKREREEEVRMLKTAHLPFEEQKTAPASSEVPGADHSAEKGKGGKR